ncbi:MAG: hypothetical protein US62_C0001G0017 [Candidatus Woesebacteria bacterium GW2011_GWA1_37_8]|uniref:Dockerin domain-containing protein n=1 Tax=Candidatus Woesebacteria bacterium GW2011_GWA1_37_8 TaxID=1618546 RepID=A0A0G0KB69_9BACT|nr:MAG: hypothetical protein US62_C0001G0017 [Candidatus Woesebacteria bacterium GW2011_GWA1_37_8]
MTCKLLLSIILTSIFLVKIPQKAFAQTQHPFLIVKASDFASLRNRTLQSPWREMKDDAVATCQNTVYDLSNPPIGGKKSFTMRDIMSSCSLAFILDQNNQEVYKQKLVESYPKWSDILNFQHPPDGNIVYSQDAYVYPATAFFHSILALDVIHDSLNSQDLLDSEYWLTQEYNHYYNAFSDKPPLWESTQIIWSLYLGKKGDDPYIRVLLNGGRRPGDSRPITGFMPELVARISPDGVYYEGPGYGYVAWGHNRDERTMLPDVLEFTGVDNRYYNNSRFKNLHEWLYGYASTPFAVEASFGDTSDYYPLWSFGNGSRLIESAHIAGANQYSNLAGQYAYWKWQTASRLRPDLDLGFKGRLINYVLLRDNSVAQKPESRIFPNGGSFFLESNSVDGSLYGVLWNVNIPNPNSPEFHMHDDINSVYIAGYGEPLLVNGGFGGASTNAGADSCPDYLPQNQRYTPNYLSHRAVSNNTALINYQIGNPLDPSNVNDHQGKSGLGIIEGITGGLFDYASGNSGSALPNGTHIRNFVFIHPQDSKNGYFALFDEVTATSSGVTNIVLHPNSETTSVVTDKAEYLAPLGTNVFNNSMAGISLFLGTQPQQVDILNGVLCHWDNYDERKSIIGKYLFSTYQLDSDNKKNIVTVLFPTDANHLKPQMNRLQGNNYSGAELIHGGGVNDFLLESKGNNLITYQGASFQGPAAIFRKNNQSLNFYFVRKGRSFSYGSERIGFESTQDLSIHLKGTNGKFYSGSENDITIYYPGIMGLLIDNLSPTVLTSGNGFVRIRVAEGNHTISITTPTTTQTITPTQTVFPGDANGDGKVDGADYVIWLNHYNQNVGGASNGDFNNNGRVDGADYVIWLTNYI